MIKNPILLNFPLPLQTKRLLIRPMMPGDGKQIFDAIQESREVLGEWLEWVNDVKVPEDSEGTVREFYAKFILRKEELTFVIFREEDLIGVCSLHDIKWNIPSAAIGYWCRAREQGKGYIREAIAALTKYAFHVLNFKRIIILADDANTKSVSIPEALKFNLETKSKGLLAKPGIDELRLTRLYVRFDADGLEDWEAKW